MFFSELLYHLFEAVLLIVAIVSSVVVLTNQSLWKREMKAFAKDHHFESPGRYLPDGFILRRTSLHNLEITNVLQGTLRGTDMVVFTASSTTKDGHVSRIRAQTVVAFLNVQRLGSRQIPPTGDPKLWLEVAGDWLILYYCDLVVGKEQLAGWCEKMYAVAQRLTSNVNAA